MGIKVRHNGQWVEMGFAGAPGGEPVGTIIAWGGSAANIPSNFRLCNGQALSRTTYSDLFSKLGTIHGSGDGSTTFNIPDLRNKFIVGAKTGGNNNYPSLTVGATGGSADAVVVQHQHGAGTLTGITTDRYFRRFPDYGLMEIDGHHSDDHGSYRDLQRTINITGSTANEGVSATNANLPPYYALCYIIKIDTSSATGGSGVPDGDYGDITVSSSGSVWNIDQDTIGPTELIATGVSAGNYTNATISVDVDGRITAASSGGNIISTFIGLSDTPSTYTGSAGKVLVVNNTQNGVDFVDSTTIGTTTFIGLSDTPSSYTADKWLKVNSAANALEFVDAPSGGSGGGGEPVGTIMAWSGTSASIPAGYQLCDGGAAATADLQAITGSNVPDLRNRFIVGAYDSVGDTTYPALSPGAVGGSADAVLISHSHTYGRATYRTLASGGAHGAELSNITSDNTSIEGRDINGNSSTSQTGTNANLPPYYALCYIIKHTGPNGSTAPGGNPFGLLTAKAATGTEVVFDNIPADAREITLMLNEVGLTNVSYHLLVQLGTSSGWIQTGYYASSEAENATYDVSSNVGFPIHNRNGATSTGNRFTGSMVINLLRTNPSRTYTQIGQFKRWASSLNCENCASACQSYGGVDSISSDAEITRIRILANHTLGNVQSFTTGTIGVSYKSNSSGSSGSGAYVDKITEGTAEAEVVDLGTSSADDNYFKVTTDGTEKLRITRDGRVGIGSTQPIGVLDLNSTTGDANVIIRTFSNNLGNTQLLFGDTANHDTGKVQYNHPENFLAFHTNGSEQVRITSNGSVGIGTTTPSGSQNPNPLFTTKLDVFKSFVGGGDGSFVGRFYGLDTNVQETSVRFVTKGTGGNAADLHNASDAYLMHGISNGDTKFVFGANGNVGIGTSVPNDPVTSSNTAKLAVGIVTCNELYVNGTQVTGGGSGGGGEPVGTIIAWSGTVATIPTGYQLCDGSAASTSALQAITGPNVPDLTNRFIIGADADATINSVVLPTTSVTGSATTTGGSKDAIVVSHRHTTDDYVGRGSYAEPRNYGVGTDGNLNSTGTTGDAQSISDPITNIGESGTNKNLPPYYALCYIIKHTATSGSGGSSGGTTKVAILSDVKSSGTAGGSFASGSWIDRTLNTEVDPESFVTFNSSNDYFALESGTYKINWSAPAYNTGEHKTQLVHANNTSFTSPTNIQGTSEFDSSGIEPNTQTRSFGETVVTITETTYFKLQHRCAATQNSNGLGIESNFSVDEVYSQIVVQDLSSGGGSGGSTGDKISEGDSKAEIIDTATESKFTVEIDAAEKFSVDIGGPKIHRQNSSLEGGSIVFNRAADDVAAFEIDVYGSSSSDSGRLRIIDSTGGGERFAIGPNGEIGLGYVSATSADYGSAGQVLTSGGSGASVTWADAPSGGGGGTVSSGTFTATAGSPSTLESYTYDSAELVFEYTVFVKNGSNYQTQKLLVMRDGTTVDSSQFAVMYSNNLLVQLDATISGSNLLLRATPETGVTGNTTYRIKREVM